MDISVKAIGFYSFLMASLPAIWAFSGTALAHCDTMGGPVILTAQAALEKGDVTPVLKWVREEDEKEIRSLFKKALAMRKLGPEAKEIADMYFFETLVRIHRAGEGAPYTGLKPAGEVEPSVMEADRALESGTADALTMLVAGSVSEGIKERFHRALEARKYADESVEKGREFVRAYVEFTHYVERLHMDAEAKGSHHMEPGAEGGGGNHHN